MGEGQEGGGPQGGTGRAAGQQVSLRQATGAIHYFLVASYYCTRERLNDLSASMSEATSKGQQNKARALMEEK